MKPARSSSSSSSRPFLLFGSETKIHGPMDSSLVVDGGRRARKSETDSLRPRAFRGYLQDPMDSRCSSFKAAVACNGGDGDGGVDASALCWMVVRRWGCVSTQYGSVS